MTTHFKVPQLQRQRERLTGLKWLRSIPLNVFVLTSSVLQSQQQLLLLRSDALSMGLTVVAGQILFSMKVLATSLELLLRL
jgi:hypothetical protein